MIGGWGPDFAPGMTLTESRVAWGLPRHPKANQGQRAKRKVDNRRRSKAARRARKASRG